MCAKFAELGILPFLEERIEERKIAEPTEIQKEVIPLLLKREKLLFRSATGTGKTLAYLLPIVQLILNEGQKNPPGPHCLITAPTHELCSQIKQEADFLLAGTGLKATLLIGSAQMGRQIEALKKDRPVIVAGNPGRLLGLAREKKLKLSSLEFAVLDEGDRLVSDELAGDTTALVSFIKKAKDADSNICFVSCSATFSSKSRERLFPLLDEGGGEKTKLIEGKENILRELVEHWAIFSEERRKAETLRSFIIASSAVKRKGSAKLKFLIFTARGREVGNIVARLLHYKIDAAGLWGEMDKKARKKAIYDFRFGKVRFLVTSDLAARGLDIPDIDYVIALDTGEDPDTYIHRAGRTARAGKKGIMVSIGTEAEMRRLSALEKKLGITVYPKEVYGGKIEAPVQISNEE